MGATAIAAVIRQLTRVEERIDAADIDALERQAAELYAAMRGRADVAALLGAGICHYEVPFTHRPAGRPGETVRGVIDCLVVAPDGSVTVLEFKTGRPRPEHEAQAALYAEAAGVLVGQGRVSVKIVYP
jgi:sarcosine oxidase gamma subunit